MIWLLDRAELHGLVIAKKEMQTGKHYDWNSLMFPQD